MEVAAAQPVNVLASSNTNVADAQPAATGDGAASAANQRALFNHMAQMQLEANANPLGSAVQGASTSRMARDWIDGVKAEKALFKRIVSTEEQESDPSGKLLDTRTTENSRHREPAGEILETHERDPENPADKLDPLVLAQSKFVSTAVISMVGAFVKQVQSLIKSQ